MAAWPFRNSLIILGNLGLIELQDKPIDIPFIGSQAIRILLKLYVVRIRFENIHFPHKFNI